MKNTGKKILVTGGAGYVGSALVRGLLRKGYQVRVFDKLLFGDFGLREVASEIELVKGDILKPPRDLMRGIDAVVHMAALASQAGASYRSPRYTDLVNHIGTEVMARQAKVAGVRRFVFSSSCSIYCGYKLREDEPAPPLLTEDESKIFTPTPYALSRRAAEEALLELADETFEPVMLRKGTVYGYSPKMRYDLVINSFTKDAFRQKKIVVYAGGEIFRPMLDIEQAVSAYIAALELPSAAVAGKIFNAASGNYTMIELARQFQKILKERQGQEIEIEVRPFEAALSYRADCSRFQKAFALPSRPLASAIMEIWQHLENGEDYNDPRFYNDLWHEEVIKRGLI